MPKPRKDGQPEMASDLEVPLTREHKDLIKEASRFSTDGLSAWARRVLLEAARKEICRRPVEQENDDGLSDMLRSKPA
jgi:hypothetical protein